MSLLEFNFNEEAISQLEKLADATDAIWAEVLSQSLDCFCQVVEIAKKSSMPHLRWIWDNYSSNW